MRIPSRRVGVGAVVLLMLGGGVCSAALAYWSEAGVGTSAVAVAVAVDSASAPVVNQTSQVVALAPGVAPQLLYGNFSNDASGAQVVRVNSVTASVSGVSRGGVVVAACTAADFTITNPTMQVNALIPVGGNVGAWSGAAIAFNNTAVNQDECKDALVKIIYVAR